MGKLMGLVGKSYCPSCVRSRYVVFLYMYIYGRRWLPFQVYGSMLVDEGRKSWSLSRDENEGA